MPAKFPIQFRRCKDLYPAFSPSNAIAIRLYTTHLVNEVDETLSFLAPKVPCGSDL